MNIGSIGLYSPCSKPFIRIFGCLEDSNTRLRIGSIERQERFLIIIMHLKLDSSKLEKKYSNSG